MELTAVGPYEVVRPLGAGGMGEVFLGRDTRLHRQVALKRILAADDSRAWVLREARAAARLTHPNIAAVYDVLDVPGGAFIVMEYVEGESLAARIARGPLPPDEAVAIGRQLASALAAAHREGVIHRDLKPSNVQLTPDGTAKVLDFGVAKLSALNTSAPTVSAAPTTAASMPGNPGTPAYMAPEQLAGCGADERSDVYALGAVMYEMTTGVRPYRGRDVLSLVEEVAHGEPRPASELNPQVPPWLTDVIAHALKRDPAARFASAATLQSALARESPVASRELSWIRWVARETRCRRTWLGAAAGVLAVAAVIAVPMLRRPNAGRTSPPPRAVLAILPVDNPTGDPNAEYVGAGMRSVVAGNLSSIAGLTVLSGAATAPYQNRRGDVAALRRDLGADYVLDMTITSVTPQPAVIARLKSSQSGAAAWDERITGDALTIEKDLLDRLGKALEARAVSRRFSNAEWARIKRLPTTSGSALTEYSQARALLDAADTPGNPGKAVALLTHATHEDPRFALAYATLGDALWAEYQRSKDTARAEQAKAAVMEALRIDPEQAPVYYSLGNMRYLTGAYNDAIDALRRAIALQPDFDDAHRILGRVLADTNHLEDGLAELRTAIAIRPNYWNNYYTLGYVLYGAGRYDEALQAYRRVTELQPSLAGAYQMLGTIHYIRGDFDQAIGEYEHAARLGPSRAALSNLALAYYDGRRYDDALRTYRQALERDPNSVLAHRNVGDVLRKLGRNTESKVEYEEAVKLAQSALRVNPRDVDPMSLLAVCEAKLGRARDARGHAAEAVAIAPENRYALQRAAEVHAILGDIPDALRDLAAAIEHGYDKGLAKRNDDLSALRGRREFDQLVSTHGAPAISSKR